MYLWIFILTFSFYSCVYSLKRYYATESCGHVHGPDQLTVLEFDRDGNKPSGDETVLPPVDLRNTVWECIIVVRGMPSVATNRSIGLQWRDFHIWDPETNEAGDTVEDCGKAYVTVFKGSDTSSRRQWTICGKDTKRIFFEWIGDYITFKFYVDFRRKESWVPPSTTTQTTTLGSTSPCMNPMNVTDNSTTPLPMCLTTSYSNITTSPPDLYPYPEVYFRADVTSFDYACTKSKPGEVLKCNDSQRCLDESLMCDYFYSQNCKSMGFPGDRSDQTRDAPAYCFRIETTTPVPTTTTEPPPKPFNWQAVVGAVGGLLGMATLAWCCWRPGYLPWRLSRLRNAPIFNTQKCVCCRRGPTVCCPCFRCCAGNEADVSDIGIKNPTGASKLGSIPNGKNGPLHTSGGKYYVSGGSSTSSVTPASHYGQDPNNFATDWLKLISGDGAHLREQR